MNRVCCEMFNVPIRVADLVYTLLGTFADVDLLNNTFEEDAAEILANLRMERLIALLCRQIEVNK